MNQLRGFTLIELLVSITISTILASFGINAYTKGQQKQVIKSATDSLITQLQAIHQDALIGKRPADCTGKFEGYQIKTTASSSNLTTQPICDSITNSTEYTIPNLTFLTSASFVFKPLASGFDLGDSTTLNLDYQDLVGNTHRFLLYSTGNIEDLGVIE